jgi:hypothetical protein
MKTQISFYREILEGERWTIYKIDNPLLLLGCELSVLIGYFTWWVEVTGLVAGIHYEERESRYRVVNEV